MRKILSIFFFITLVVSSPLFGRNIDIDSIVKKSVTANKHLFIFLHRTDCGYCESMLMFTLDDDPVRELMEKKFKYLQINISENDVVKYKKFKGNGREFAKHVGYNIYPSSLFLNKRNEIVYAIAGYQSKEHFYETLKCVDTRGYKKMDCSQYTSKKVLK